MPGPFLVGQRLTADLMNTAAYRPYAKCHQTVAQTGLTNASTNIISFTTEDHDPEGWHDNVTNNSRITPLLAGDYRVTVQGGVSATTTCNNTFTGIFLNGALYTRSGNYRMTEPVSSNLSIMTPTHVDTVTMNGTTDYLEMVIGISTSATESTNVSSTGFSRMIVEYLGNFN